MLVLAVVATAFSLKLGISVAIIEIVIGIIAGNFLHFSSAGHDWLIFLAGLGSVVLTFLAGAEIDPEAMRQTWKASLSIGIMSFLAPFIGALIFSYYFLSWTWAASLLAGVALSTTSVAVVYVVLVETGLSKTGTGKLILSACFVTDLGTAIALSLLFVRPNAFILVLFAALAVAIVAMPKILGWLFSNVKGRSGELEMKISLLMIVAFGALAEISGSHAVLPAYIIGLVLANVYAKNKDVLMKLRTIALAFLTPFFFINAGLNVSLAAVVSGIMIVGVLFAVKMGTKFIGVFSLSSRFIGKDAVYTTLLMSTGLTFGTISAQYGLTAGIITRDQFSILVMVVMLTAIVPTIIAQKWFKPNETPSE